MSDTREAVNEAVRQNRLLLAKLQVRDEALAEEIKSLTSERGTATAELHEALGAKIAQLQQERAGIAAQREQIVTELGALDKLKGKIPAMEAQALARDALAFTGADPDAPPPSARTMSEDEARAQLAALKAQRAGGDPPKPADPETPPDGERPRKRTL
jgi:chromosome segregation ATPase